MRSRDSLVTIRVVAYPPALSASLLPCLEVTRTFHFVAMVSHVRSHAKTRTDYCGITGKIECNSNATGRVMLLKFIINYNSEVKLMRAVPKQKISYSNLEQQEMLTVTHFEAKEHCLEEETWSTDSNIAETPSTGRSAYADIAGDTDHLTGPS